MLRGWSRTRLAIAIVVASCGGAFTTAPDDSGPATNLDGSLDAPVVDGPMEDVRVGRDAARRDAVAEDVTTVDSSPEPKDGNPVDHDGGPVIPDAGPDVGSDVGSDASVCLRTCPSGFECLATKCVDRAAPHFSATMAQPANTNWSYGYAASAGGTFTLYTLSWRAGASIDVWTRGVTSTLEPSVFHNSGSTVETYGGMTLKAGLLGLFPGATAEESILRWIAPSAGSYTIDATFTGISTPATKVIAGVLIKQVSANSYSQALNAFMDGNVFMFPSTTQSLAGGDAVDFYVYPIFNADDSTGGTELAATITAN
jgi:hypothetical protein